MKINEIVVESRRCTRIVESEQLDELNWQDIKTGAAKAGKAVSKGASSKKTCDFCFFNEDSVWAWGQNRGSGENA